VSPTLKELSHRPTRLTEGHRLCAGCAEPIIARQVLMATDKPVVVSNATGCFEVSTSVYPFTAWDVPWIHSAFENASATIGGVESAYKALQRKGKYKEDIRFVVFGGDTPGKKEYPKDLTKIIIAHDLPYAAQASPHNWKDMVDKAAKGFEIGGPAFLNVVSPCPRGWRHDSAQTVQIAKLAVETCMLPLYEYERGTWRLTGDSKRIAEGKKEKRPMIDWFKAQGRFRQLLTDKWASVAQEVQANVDKKWDEIKKLCKE
jgi:pyruvate ferredoxin oxidoreductase beta subunit